MEFFRKNGLLFATILLFGTMITLYLIDKDSGDTTPPSGVIDDKWPCYQLSKTDLQAYFKEDGTPASADNKICLIVRIDNAEQPYSSMSMWKAGARNLNEYGNFTKAGMNAKNTSKGVPRLFMSINEILLDDLRPLLFDKDASGKWTWKKEFSYLLITPEESKIPEYANYLDFECRAMKGDDTVLDPDPAAELYTIPVPPGRPH